MSFERPNIQRMQGYTSGEQPADGLTIKLNTNENPYPPSPTVNEALASINPDDLRRYPPPTADAFRDTAARLHAVDRDNIIATRGGDELLRLIITTFVAPGDLIAMTQPTYSLYPVLAQIQDCPILEVPLTDDWTLASDFTTTVNTAGAKLTLIVNPHAPTGQLLDRPTIKRLAEELDGVVLIDEAYIDFVEPELQHDCLSLCHEFDNLLFLRSLSKGYGLAGLRFGYGIGATSLILPMLSKTRDSYNLDLISQRIATQALADQTYAQQQWRKVRSERARVREEMAVLGLVSPPSHGNFLLATVPSRRNGSAEGLYQALKRDAILVRYFDQPRLSDKLRISIGTAAENDQLLDAVTRYMARADE